MLYELDITKVLFLDIETVSKKATYEELSEKEQILWGKKANFLKKNEESDSEIYNRAGIYAEFGKIVCISVGFVNHGINGEEFRIKSYYGDDEKLLLEEFAELLNKHYFQNDQMICGHNAKEFDFPYIARRMLVHSIKIPKILNTAGLKPWEVKHIDTMQLWRFGDYKHYTSLELLAALFNIPTPKDDISGADVGRVYWEENDLERIKEYCQKDVITLVHLLKRYRGEKLIPDENISALE